MNKCEGLSVWPGQLRIVSIRWIVTCGSTPLREEVLLSSFGTSDLARVPRIQVFCPACRGGYSSADTPVTWGLPPSVYSRRQRTSHVLLEHSWDSFTVYPCGNFSGTSSLKPRGTKGSIGHTFMVCIHTENQNQGDFYPFVLLEISVLHEPPLGHLRYGLTDVPPQPNSPPDNVFSPGRPAKDLNSRSWT